MPSFKLKQFFGLWKSDFGMIVKSAIYLTKEFCWGKYTFSQKTSKFNFFWKLSKKFFAMLAKNVVSVNKAASYPSRGSFWDFLFSLESHRGYWMILDIEHKIFGKFAENSSQLRHTTAFYVQWLTYGDIFFCKSSYFKNFHGFWAKVFGPLAEKCQPETEFFVWRVHKIFCVKNIFPSRNFFPVFWKKTTDDGWKLFVCAVKFGFYLSEKTFGYWVFP